MADNLLLSEVACVLDVRKSRANFPVDRDSTRTPITVKYSNGSNPKYATEDTGKN